MKEVRDDILKFNTYLRGMIRSLNKHGEQLFNLITYLTKGYIGSQDKTFRRYINDLIERNENNSSSVLILEILIVKVVNKHKIHIQSNPWIKPDDVDKELMALYAEVYKKK